MLVNSAAAAARVAAPRQTEVTLRNAWTLKLLPGCKRGRERRGFRRSTRAHGSCSVVTAMYKLTIALLTVLASAPLTAQRRIDFLIDAEGARRTGQNQSFTPGMRFDPQFGTGGGAGAGLNFFLSDRVSI